MKDKGGKQLLGCSEYRDLSRRQFLHRTATFSVVLATSPSWMPRVAYAATENSSRDVLVSVFMRGGFDGLTLCAPFGDTGYYANRPQLSIRPPDAPTGPKLANLDGFFGLPPSMAPLLPAYQNRGLAIVHAAGLKNTTRSHFEAQRFMESGLIGSTTVGTGWAGRHLMSSSPISATAVLRGLSLTTGIPTTLLGGQPVLPVPDLAESGLDGQPETEIARKFWLKVAYEDHALLEDSAHHALKTLDLLRQIGFPQYIPATSLAYPAHDFGKSMKAAAALIKADVGVEAIQAEMSGWDTHNKQGVLQGTMSELMQVFAQAMAAFYEDIFIATERKVIVVVLSEFGRKVAENSSLGTDHGHGNAMFVMGRKIEGGKVHCEWPGLGDGQLFENQDLGITIDYRDVLGEVVSRRLGNGNLSFVFPGYTPQFRNILG